MTRRITIKSQRDIIGNRESLLFDYYFNCKSLQKITNMNCSFSCSNILCPLIMFFLLECISF